MLVQERGELRRIQWILQCTLPQKGFEFLALFNLQRRKPDTKLLHETRAISGKMHQINCAASPCGYMQTTPGTGHTNCASWRQVLGTATQTPLVVESSTKGTLSLYIYYVCPLQYSRCSKQTSRLIFAWSTEVGLTKLDGLLTCGSSCWTHAVSKSHLLYCKCNVKANKCAFTFWWLLCLEVGKEVQIRAKYNANDRFAIHLQKSNVNRTQLGPVLKGMRQVKCLVSPPGESWQNEVWGVGSVGSGSDQSIPGILQNASNLESRARPSGSWPLWVLLQQWGHWAETEQPAHDRIRSSLH